MRTSKTTVKRHLDSYKAMTEVFLTIDNGKYEKKGEGAWSFFDELYKSPGLRKVIKDNPEFVEDFSRWVGDERIPNGADVRLLPKILDNSQASKKFKEGDASTAFVEAKKAVAQEDPSVDSDFFKLLAKVRESLTSVGQIKDILKIRTDRAARRELLETYQALQALIDFMHLAEVSPDEINPQKPKMAKPA